ncbi:MAG: SseB family protein, partial [Candidatus Dormibacteraeota bacterium]|nr:SseB family protein [Candidatus Dormibacteraeota bacterium]
AQADPAPALAAPVPPEAPDTLEPRLADAKSRGDHTTYFELLLSADLVLPSTATAVEDPETTEFPTTMIAGGTYVVVFTSPQALARSGHRPGLYRRTSFSQLALGWPDPSWQLAINPGLPSEVHLDPAAVARLDATQRALNQTPAPVPAPAPESEPPSPPSAPASADPVSEPPPAPAPPEVPVVESGNALAAAPEAMTAGIPLRPPHGTQLWQWDGEGDEAEAAVPAAVFDAITGLWAPVRADAVQAPQAD